MNILGSTYPFASTSAYGGYNTNPLSGLSSILGGATTNPYSQLSSYGQAPQYGIQQSMYQFPTQQQQQPNMQGMMGMMMALMTSMLQLLSGQLGNQTGGTGSADKGGTTGGTNGTGGCSGHKPGGTTTTPPTSSKDKDKTTKVNYNDNKSIQSKLETLAGGGSNGKALAQRIQKIEADDSATSQKDKVKLTKELKTQGYSDKNITQMFGLADIAKLNNIVSSLKKVQSNGGTEGKSVQARIDALNKSKASLITQYEKNAA